MALQMPNQSYLPVDGDVSVAETEEEKELLVPRVPPGRRWRVALLLLPVVLLALTFAALVASYDVLGPTEASHSRQNTVENTMTQLSLFGSSKKLAPLNAFNAQINSVTFEAGGLYWEFRTASSEKVYSGKVEGRPGSWVNAKTQVPLASLSKLFVAFAAMYTFQHKPDFHPHRYIHTFKGWEDWKNFKVAGKTTTADLTLHQLLTHTSGIPFCMRDSKSDIRRMELMFEPGTAFGYTIGHRIIGWILRDYWKRQPEARSANIHTLQDCLEFLYYKKMGLSKTRFSNAMSSLFGLSGQAGDASISSNGEDLMKLAVVALRKGRLPNGKVLISEANWNKWAVPNLLPGGKLSKDLVGWQGSTASFANLNVGGLKGKIMKQSGDFGWNYFGATYYNSAEVGWCGFCSSCLHISYTRDIAFVMMQRDVADLKKSKPYMIKHFDTMAKSLQCTGKGHSCQAAGSSQPSRYCQTCARGWFTSHRTCTDATWTSWCPSKCQRGKTIFARKDFNRNDFTCYKPRCIR